MRLQRRLSHPESCNIPAWQRRSWHDDCSVSAGSVLQRVVMPRHGRGLGLGVVLLIALAVRLHDLDGESIWADEAFSIAMVRHSVAEIAARTAADDTTPPLYYLVLH